MRYVGYLVTIRRIATCRLLVFIAVLLAFVCYVAPLRAQTATFAPELDVTVSADVSDTSLRIKGFAAPNAFITVLSDSNPIGTITAGSSGMFDKIFSSQPAGLHTIQLYAKVGEHTTDTVTQHLNIQPQAETTLTVFIPTTLTLSHRQVTEGETVTFSGFVSPGSRISLFIDNNVSFSALAGTDGRWSIVVQTKGFYAGTHYGYAIAYHQSGIQSVPTSKRPFQVRGAATGETPSPAIPPEHIQPPVITKPQTNFHTSRPSTQVCGLALANAQVELWEDNSPVGSVFANHQGEWCMDFYFNKSRHEIAARVCMVARCSGFSGGVVIFFDTPETPSPFLLQLTKYRYAPIYVGEEVMLDVTLKDGTPPYEVNISWGNEVVEDFSADKNRLSVRLAYAAAGHYSGSITAKDSKGRMQTRYFSVLVQEKPSKWPIIFASAVAGLFILTVCWYLVRRKRLAKANSRS